MDESELPSDSDASDEDYRPSGEESGAASEEEESDPDNVDEADNNDTNQKEVKNGKARKKSKKIVKRKGVKRHISEKKEPDVCENETGDDAEKQVSAEEEKKKADSLWADFLKDCGPPKKKPSMDNSISTTSCSSSNTSNCSSSSNGVGNGVNRNSESKTNSSNDLSKTTTEEKENKQTVTQIFEFAGEKIRVEKEVQEPVSSSDKNEETNGSSIRGRGGARGFGQGRGRSSLTSFLDQLGKKGKLSTLEKSKLDWDQFKKSEGIAEDIQKHNKGKEGYLEKQDFLQRTDLRRFEIEKALRQKRSGR